MKIPANLIPEVLQVLEAVPDKYIVLTPDLFIITASNAFLSGTNYERSTIAGKLLWDVLPQIFGTKYTPVDLKQHLITVLQEVLRTSKQHTIAPQPYKILTEGAYRTRYWGFSVTPVPDQEAIGYLIFKVEDVTELNPERLAEQLCEQERRYRESEVVGHMGSYEVDLSTMTYYFSDNMFRLLGFEPQSFTPSLEQVNFISHPEDALGVQQILHHAISHKQSYQYRRRIYLPDKRMRYISSHGKVLVDAQGNAVKILGIVQDITEQVEAERILQESNALLQTVFDTSFNAIVVAKSLRDANNDIIDFECILANKVATNYLQKELIGTTFFDNYLYAQESSLFEMHKKLILTGESIDLELFYDVGNCKTWFRHTAIKSGDGLVIGFEDITDRKIAEEELKQSKDLLQSIFDFSLIGMSLFRVVRDESGAIRDFQIRFINRKMEQEIGRSDLVGKLYTEEYPGILNTGVYDLMLKVMETGEPGQMDFYYDQEGFNDWYSCMFIKLDDGLISTTLNITERKLAEQELFKNYTLLQQSEDVAQLGSWEYEIARDKLTWSKGVYRLFDLPDGSPVHLETYRDYVIAEDLPRIEKFIYALRDNPQNYEDTIRIQVAGQIVFLKIKAVLLCKDNGQPEKILGVDLDISEVKRLEADNLQMRLNQQKALLLGILEGQEEERRRIAESLHNGVGQILYATKLNLNQVAKSVAKEELRMTEKLLDEAINETRQVSHHLIPVLLKDFGLEVALQDMCRKYDASDLYLHCDIKDLPPHLESNLEIALYRICQELVSNIVKHAHATGASLRLSQVENHILLQVQDNGKGFKYDATTKVGLGLRNIKDRVTLFNGTLTITKPATGKGTLITIRLPVLVAPL